MSSANTVATRIYTIVGVVLSIFTLIFSLIPCIGYYALIPGIIAALCSLIAFISLRKDGKPTGLATVGMLLGTMAVVSASYQYIQFKTVFDTKKKLENVVIDVQETVEDGAKEVIVDYTKEKIDDYLENDSIEDAKKKKQK